MKLKKLLRTAQVHVSILQDSIFTVRRFVRQICKTPLEEDFQALQLFPPSPENDVFLDVGANRGQSIDAIRLYRKTSEIVAFEPNEILFQKLSNLYRKDKTISLHNIGLGNSNGEFTLYIPFYKKWMFDGLASLDREAAAAFLKRFNQIYFYNDQFLSVQETKVRIRRLDELELSPFFMKLDVQGYEIQALKGGEKTLRTHEPILLIEWPSKQPEIFDFLAKLGYDFYRYANHQFIVNTLGRVNTFFMTRSKAALVSQYIHQPAPGSCLYERA